MTYDSHDLKILYGYSPVPRKQRKDESRECVLTYCVGGGIIWSVSLAVLNRAYCYCSIFYRGVLLTKSGVYGTANIISCTEYPVLRTDDNTHPLCTSRAHMTISEQEKKRDTQADHDLKCQEIRSTCSEERGYNKMLYELTVIWQDKSRYYVCT